MRGCGGTASPKLDKLVKDHPHKPWGLLEGQKLCIKRACMLTKRVFCLVDIWQAGLMALCAEEHTTGELVRCKHEFDGLELSCGVWCAFAVQVPGLCGRRAWGLVALALHKMMAHCM